MTDGEPIAKPRCAHCGEQHETSEHAICANCQQPVVNSRYCKACGDNVCFECLYADKLCRSCSNAMPYMGP